MQTKGKKKIIDNAGALQKKYAWKSEKQKKKPAAVCPYAKKCGGCDYQGMLRTTAAGKTDLCAQKHWGLL